MYVCIEREDEQFSVCGAIIRRVDSLRPGLDSHISQMIMMMMSAHINQPLVNMYRS